MFLCFFISVGNRYNKNNSGTIETCSDAEQNNYRIQEWSIPHSKKHEFNDFEPIGFWYWLFIDRFVSEQEVAKANRVKLTGYENKNTEINRK